MRDPESQDSEDAAEDREVAELREQNDLLERDVETFKSQLKQGREMYSQLMEEKNLALEKLEELKEKHDLIEGEWKYHFQNILMSKLLFNMLFIKWLKKNRRAW